MLSFVLSPVAAAATDSVMVIVLGPAGVHDVGDTVTIGVRVFDLGSAVDPTSLSLEVWGASSSRSLAYARESVGTFSTTFQIGSGDLSGDSSGGIDEVVVWANASVDGIAYNTTGRVLVHAPPPALQLLLASPPAWALPGTTVVVNATVLAGTTPTDPTGITIWSYLRTPLGGNGPQLYIAVTRTGTGLFSGSYQIPASAPQDSILSIGGEVTLGSEQAFADYVDVNVGVAHTFEVWMHQRALGTNYALVDILVANETGWPVAGAGVSIRYPSYQMCGNAICQAPRWLYGTTGRLGAASFNLSFAPWAFALPLPVQGNVSVGSVNQTYAGMVVGPDSGYGYRDLCPESSRLTYAAGDQVLRTYHGACGWAPFANRTYYYYAYTGQNVLANGSVRSDAQGNFTLTFTAPGDGFLIFLFTNTSIGWIRYMDFVPVADPALLHVADLGVGKVAQVTVDVLDAGGLALFLPHGPSDRINAQAPSASSTSGWSRVSCCTTPGTVAAVPGAPFHADLVTPRFLPKDQDYVLTVAVNWSIWGGYSYAFAEVVHVSNLPPVSSAVFSTLNPVSGQSLTANASGSSDPDGLIVSYAIDWGDGNSTGWTNGSDATHAYADPGTYTVTVRVQDDSGAVNATTYSVVVEGAILGVRTSTFYLVALVVVVVAVAAVGTALYLRRRGRRASEADRPEASQPPRPPETPPPGT